MKKIIFRILLMQFIALFSIAQDDLEKVRKEFEDLSSGKNGIPYGNNLAAGKYYDIRGFKMYC